MGMKYCPYCKEVVLTKVMGDYSQIVYQGVPAKRRHIAHYFLEARQDDPHQNGRICFRAHCPLVTYRSRFSY